MHSTLHLPSPNPHVRRASSTATRQHTRQTSLTARRRSSNLEERRLSTGLSAHGPPVTEEDTFLTTDISTKLQWRQLDDCFIGGAAEHAEAVDHYWIHNFGAPLLRVYKVKLESVIDIMKRELVLRENAGLSAISSDTADDTPNKEFDDLFTEGDGEVQRRRDSAEKEITLLHELNAASWQWIEAHLDYYAAMWHQILHEKGKGEISIWNDLCALRKERHVLEVEVEKSRDVKKNQTSFGWNHVLI
jgi:hypothetical protein